jgi:hypothetical protein
VSTHTAADRSRRKEIASPRPAPPLAARRIDDLKFQVGHVVEAFCDHTRDGQRVRDWVLGVVVQSDAKMVAVQFNEDVYLTDGWRIPDRILFFQQTSEHLRHAGRRRLPKRRRGRR